ncbi:MAG TPA: hypothetical protein VGP87_02540 [Gemmatimonadales bacterium]|nr:hypothetical protein [Gemmatimonadales bacterium]
MSDQDFEAAAAFLEEYALRPPRAEPHNPAVDSPRWRTIQIQLRDLARRLRQAGKAGAVEFRDADAQFLETQSSRLFRMHHWIRRGLPLAPDAAAMADTAQITAERLPLIAAMIRQKIARP